MRRRDSRRGQSIVETAMILPVVIALMTGAYDVSQLASDKLEVIAGARHGARIASQLGGIPNNPAPPAAHTCDGTLAAGTTLTSIDKQIVLSVNAATSKVTSAQISEIDIYAPSRADGVYASGDPINSYDTSGNALASPPATFGLNKRCQGPAGASPKDVSIGVRVKWTYTAAFGGGQGHGLLTFPGIVDYAVEKMTLCTDNCK